MNRTHYMKLSGPAWARSRKRSRRRPKAPWGDFLLASLAATLLLGESAPDHSSVFPIELSANPVPGVRHKASTLVINFDITITRTLIGKRSNPYRLAVAIHSQQIFESARRLGHVIKEHDHPRPACCRHDERSRDPDAQGTPSPIHPVIVENDLIGPVGLESPRR